MDLDKSGDWGMQNSTPETEKKTDVKFHYKYFFLAHFLKRTV